MSDCTCLDCQNMCRRPCWPTFEEARNLINLGFSNKLMLDFVELDDNSIVQALCPAHRGREGRKRGYFDFTRCVFQNDNLLCDLHDKGLKPKEGREALCTISNVGLRKSIADTWKSKEAQNLITSWKHTTERISI